MCGRGGNAASGVKGPTVRILFEKGMCIVKETKAAVQTEAANSDEFSNQRVPMSARKGFLSLLTVSLGYVFVVTSMQAGGNIGAGLLRIRSWPSWSAA